MLNFIFTLLIIFLIVFEIFATYFLVKYLVALEKKIDEFHLKLIETSQIILEINDEINKILKKINKVVKFIANKRIYQIKNIVLGVINIVQIVLLFKSLKIEKGADKLIKKLDFKVLKKVAIINISQKIIKKFLDVAQNLCAI